MTQEPGIAEEEMTEAEEVSTTKEPEIPPERTELPKQTHFDKTGLGPLLDVYMQKRGITNRTQAAALFQTVISEIDYDPRRDIQNVDAYIRNLSTVINTIPDTPETLHVKGALMARGASDAAGMLSTSHFGGKTDEMEDLKGIMKYGMKIKAAFSALDNAYGGGNTSQESEKVKELTGRLDRIEKKNEFDAALAPLQQQLGDLADQIKELAKKPGTPEESTALKELNQSIDKINSRFDKKEEQDAFTAEMQGIRSDFKAYQESLPKGGGTPGGVGDVFDQAISLMDKINEVNKKYGGGGEGELDWRAVAISTTGEIATEAIKAARDIMAGQEGEEETVEETKKEPISQRIVDKKVLSYIRDHAAAGAKEINTKDAAKALKLTERQVFDSYQRLEAKGLVTAPGTKKPKPEAKGIKTGPSKWVEGD